MHGKQSQIRFERLHQFSIKGIGDNRSVIRYHSILIEEMPEEFEVTARSTDDQTIMGFKHKTLHDLWLTVSSESIGTSDGYLLFKILSEKVVKVRNTK